MGKYSGDVTRQMAIALAESQQFKNWRLIETHLRGCGHVNAKAALDDLFLRKQIDLACQGRSIFDE